MPLKEVDAEKYRMFARVETEAEPVPSTSMEIGEMGVIVDDEDSPGPYKGHIILRIYDGAVSLNRPEATWMGRGWPFKVRRIKSTSALTLIAK